MKTFGDNLKGLMKNKHVTARQLAASLNLPYKSVQDWLVAGNRVPRNPEVLRKLSAFFGCSIEFLLFGEESKPSIENFLESTLIHSGVYEIRISKVVKKD